MPGRIRRLGPGVVEKIAAGEVVQRPVNVVKELVENSLDAMSTSITVEIHGGGMDSIRVTDNGRGIPPQDALIAFERHATSKITSEDELYALTTLGFRGEALASIAQVSRTTLTTRVEDAQSGYAVTVRGGEVVERGEAGCPEGTTIVVRELFYNMPVRRRFNNSASLEANHISDLVSRLILSNPTVSFRYINNEKTVYHSAGTGDMKNALFSVYGASLLHALMGVEFDDGYVKISGHVSDVNVSRSNRTQQSFFVNGRYVRSPLLSDAVQEAFGARLPKGKFPVLVAGITLAPEEVDVNIHPAKLAVRFHDEARVREAMTQAVSNALAQTEGVPKLFPGLAAAKPAKAAPPPNIIDPPIITANAIDAPAPDSQNAEPGTEAQEANFSKKAQPPDVNINNIMEAGAKPLDPDKLQTLRDAMRPQSGNRLRAREAVRTLDDMEPPPMHGEQQELDAPVHIIGNAYDTYWFVQKGKDIYVVDQHAAHERLNYDRLLESVRSGGAQQMLEPAVVRLSAAQSGVLAANIGVLMELGFEVDEFGPLTWRVRAIPNVLNQQGAEAFLIDALDALAERRSTAFKLETLMMMACKASIKAGDAITPKEIAFLFEAQATDGPLTCPHGRPIMLKFTKGDLERLFKR